MPAIERVTITLPADLLEEVDQLERNRSRFIAEAVQREVARRRHAALMLSVQSPHPETMQLSDEGLADWTSELPDDEGLLDPTGGIAVRWVAGRRLDQGIRVTLERGTVVLVELDPTEVTNSAASGLCVAVSDPAVNADQRFPLIAVVPVTGTAGSARCTRPSHLEAAVSQSRLRH